MKITIPRPLFQSFYDHLFQNELEQGAFLFGRVVEGNFVVNHSYLVPSGGWDVQLEVYLEMKDSERAKIMRIALDREAGVIDCHSHPRSRDDVWFSVSDIAGITAFADYAKWKLRGGIYIATVWGEASVDGVFWSGDFKAPSPIEFVAVDGAPQKRFIPTGSWFREPRAYKRSRR